MIQNSHALAEPTAAVTRQDGPLVDLAAHRVARRPSRWDEAAAAVAAAALVRLEIGHGGWTELAAALIAPFNP